MNRSELFFNLPQELIAQTPAEPRDHCRLMAINRRDKGIRDDVFLHIGNYLRAGDVLVFNQSKVIPARLFASKPSGGKIEVLLLRRLSGAVWSCLYGGKVVEGQTLTFAGGVTAVVLPREGKDSRIQFSVDGSAFMDFLQAHGKMPTPPYIKKTLKDAALYQTIFAKEEGSAAAPTAGLHFTQSLLDELSKKGISQEFVTLHVGLGTFQPVKTERVEDHPIHSEWYSIEPEVLARLKAAKQSRRRIIAVGTTSVRVLETVFSSVIPTEAEESHPSQKTISGETSIFIYPGYQFKVVDALITNFHTPYSSLLALVYAFAGQGLIRKAYQHAIEEKYRFFSFGDALLIE